MKSTHPYTKPLPQILPETEVFWNAARQHKLVIQYCRSCGKYIHFPRLLCPHCLSKDLDWKTSSGKGVVYSYTIIRQAANPQFEPEVPYVYAIIELVDEGVRMMSNIINIEPEAVSIGMNVRVVFESVTPEITIPKFEPA